MALATTSYFSAFDVTDGSQDRDISPILIIISPITYLMNEQVERCSTFGSSSILLTDDAKQKDDIVSGKVVFVFGSPETFLLDERWRSLLLSKVYKENVIGVVVDECHTVIKW